METVEDLQCSIVVSFRIGGAHTIGRIVVEVIMCVKYCRLFVMVHSKIRYSVQVTHLVATSP